VESSIHGTGFSTAAFGDGDGNTFETLLAGLTRDCGAATFCFGVALLSKLVAVL